MRDKFKKVLEVAKARSYSKTEMSTKDSSKVESDMVQDSVNLHPLVQSTKESGVKINRWGSGFYSHYQTS